jgi:hypothetical protein
LRTLPKAGKYFAVQNGFISEYNLNVDFRNTNFDSVNLCTRSPARAACPSSAARRARSSRVVGARDAERGVLAQLVHAHAPRLDNTATHVEARARTEPELAAALDVVRGAQQCAVGVRRQEAARLATLQRAEARVPDAVLELSRTRGEHGLRRVAAARANLGNCGCRLARLEIRVLVRAVALVPESPQHAELLEAQLIVAVRAQHEAVWHRLEEVEGRRVLHRVLVVVPVAEGAHAVGAHKVSDALEAAEAPRRHVTARLAKELHLRVPISQVAHEQPWLDANALAGAQLVGRTVRVLVAAPHGHAHAVAHVRNTLPWHSLFSRQ